MDYKKGTAPWYDAKNDELYRSNKEYAKAVDKLLSEADMKYRMGNDPMDAYGGKQPKARNSTHKDYVEKDTADWLSQQLAKLREQYTSVPVNSNVVAGLQQAYLGG